jgi:cobalt-precorrin 5A hydrolase
MASEETMIVAGLGFRRGTSAEALEMVISMALERARLGRGELDALATLAEKAEEPGLLEVSRVLALPVIACSPTAMLQVSDRTVTASARAQATVGVPSVAEAAALVGAGRSSMLRVARVSTDSATCAIAEGEG